MSIYIASSCEEDSGGAPPASGSNVTSVSYNTGTETLTVITDEPNIFTTNIPLSHLTDNLDGSYTFDNGVDAPVTFQTGTMQLLTYAALITLMSINGVVPGVFYKITDRADLGLIVQGTEQNQVSLAGSGGYLNPDFQAVGDYSGIPGFVTQQGIWTAANEAGYANGDVVIWNGLHYEVVNSGAFNGTAPDINVTAYTVHAKSLTTGYIQEWDYVEFDTPNDWVNVRKDRRGNEIGGSYSYENGIVLNGFNVITKFQWGSNRVISNYCRESLYDNLNCSGNQYENRVTENSNLLLNAAPGSAINNTLAESTSFNGNAFTGSLTSNVMHRSAINANASQALFTENELMGATIHMDAMSNKQFAQNNIQGSTIVLTNFGIGAAVKFTNNIVTNGSLMDFGNSTANVIYNELNLGFVYADACASIFTNNILTNGQINCENNTNWISGNRIYSASVMLTNNQGRFFSNEVALITNANFNNNTGFVSNCKFLDGSTIDGTNNAGTLSYITVEQGSTLTITDNQAGISNVYLLNGSTLLAANNLQQLFQMRLNNGCIIFATNNQAQISNIVMENLCSLDVSATLSSALIDQLSMVNNCTADFSTLEGLVGSIKMEDSATVNSAGNKGTFYNSSIRDRSTIQLINQGSDGHVSGCTIDSGSTVDCTDNDGDIAGCTFDSGINATVKRKTSAFALRSCRFSNGFTVTIPESTNFGGELLERGKNTFYTELDITGLTTIDMSASNWAGVITLTSGNSAEVVNKITNTVDSWDYKFTPANGLQVDMTATAVASAVADDIVLENDTSIKLFGRPLVSDNIIMHTDNGVPRQVAGSII